MTLHLTSLARRAVERVFEGADVHIVLLDESDRRECVVRIASPVSGRSVELRVSDYWTEVVITDLGVSAIQVDDLATETDKAAEVELCTTVAAAYLRDEGQVIRDRSPFLRRARVTYDVTVDGRRWQMRRRTSTVSEPPPLPDRR